MNLMSSACCKICRICILNELNRYLSKFHIHVAILWRSSLETAQGFVIWKMCTP